MTNKATDKLLPCPFCGEQPSISSYISESCNDRHLEVMCENEECGASQYVGGEHLCDDRAINAWNTRTTPTEPEEV